MDFVLDWVAFFEICSPVVHRDLEGISRQRRSDVRRSRAGFDSQRQVLVALVRDTRDSQIKVIIGRTEDVVWPSIILVEHLEVTSLFGGEQLRSITLAECPAL